MRTFAERKADIHDLMTDPDLNITWKEFAVYGYYWYRYELARSQRAKARRNINKYAEKLNNSKRVFALRKSMKNL